MNRYSLITTMILTLFVSIVMSCGDSRDSSDNSSQLGELMRGASQGYTAPSTSSVDAENSVSPTPEEIAEMSDEEIIAAVTTHDQSILTHLQAVDTSSMSEQAQERISTMIQRLSSRIEQLQEDPEFQAEVVEKVRTKGFRPFKGGYEGKRMPQQRRRFSSLDELCSFLEEKIESDQFRSERIKSQMTAKYENECSDQDTQQ